jgi:DNA-binding NtrC family response regulator
MKPTILVVDDEIPVLRAIQNYLEAHNHEVIAVESCVEAERAFLENRPDAAVVDYSLPDGNALDLLPRIRAIDSTTPFVILTGFGSIELAVRAIKEGADQFFTKPIEMSVLAVVLQRLIEGRRDRRRRLAGRAASQRERLDPFIGRSDAITRLQEQAQRVLGIESPVLIIGETGAGKGVLAHWLHENGPRLEEAFVDINCAGLSRDFLETDLFGHERGAFTGAHGSKQGLLEVADHGTVFLDEIGDVDLAVQPKLLKVIEEKRFRRLGGIHDHQVDIRLVAATHQDLEQLAGEQKFRSDLFYRINTFILRVPPLRDRIEDIEPLAEAFLAEFSSKLGRERLRFKSDAIQALSRHRWAGNIRELRNVVERVALLSAGSEVSSDDLGLSSSRSTEGSKYDVDLTLDQLEKRHIEKVLQEESGRIEAAAKRLGIHRSSLYNKVKKHGIDLAQY